MVNLRLAGVTAVAQRHASTSDFIRFDSLKMQASSQISTILVPPREQNSNYLLQRVDANRLSSLEALD
jgi:hypothetical protein